MLAGPLPAVELTTASRRLRNYVVRTLCACAFGLAMWIHFAEGTFTAAQPTLALQASRASGFFTSYAVLQTLVVLFVSPALASGAIALERERRTIEYLLTTDLGSGEIVLGKFLARLVQLVALLLVGFPILAAAGLMGGIDPVRLTMVLVIDLIVAVSITSLSIAVSAFSPRARDAVVRVYLIVIALLFFPLLLRSPLGLWGLAIPDLLARANPLALVYDIAVRPTAALWRELTELAVAHLITAILCLVCAVLAVRRAHVAAAGSARRVARGRSHLLRPRVGNAPMLWKELFIERGSSRWGRTLRLLGAFALVAFVGVAIWQFIAAMGGSASNQYLVFASMANVTAGSAILLIVAAAAAASISRERESGTWIALTTTLVEPREIIGAKVLGALYTGRWIAGVLLLVWVVGALIDPRFLVYVPIGAALLLVLASFAATLGVYVSLRCATTLRAMAITVSILVFVGLGYLFCCIPVFFTGGDEMMFATCIPLLLVMPLVMVVEGPSSVDQMFAVMFFGFAAYVGGALSLWFSSIATFEEATGRTRPPSSFAKRPPVTAQVVESPPPDPSD